LERTIEKERSFIPSFEIRREKVNYKSYREIMRRKLKMRKEGESLNDILL
jgi:hypothetical protein